MRALTNHQSTQTPAPKEETASRFHGSSPDAGWRFRNHLAAAIMLAVIGIRLIGPAQPPQTRTDGPQAVQTADWIDDVIIIITGGKP